MATTGRVTTMADNTLRVVVEINPRDAKSAFAMFGTQGTAVAIALLKPEAAINHENKGVEEEGYGKSWELLHKRGTFYAPEIHRMLGIDEDIERMRANGAEGKEITDRVKRQLYEEYDVDSLTKLPPSHFRNWCRGNNIEHLLPSDF